MFKHLPPTLARWTLVFLGAVLAVGLLVQMRRTSAALLRSDPDILSSNQPLMRYGITRGGAIYQSHCLSCHGKNGSGDPSSGVPVLSDDDWLYGTGSVSDIERIVTYGIRSDNPKAWNLAVMPGFARARPSPANAAIVPLAPAEISDVIEFLIQKQRNPADAAAAARGAAVYQGVGGCYDCHSPDAKGDAAIGAPNLVDRTTLYGNGDRDALHASIASGRQGICPAWIDVLSPESIREVALYVYQLSHPTPQLQRNRT